MKRAVVSFADGGHNGMYQQKMKRLEQSLKGRTDADFLGFTDYKQIGSPTHQQIPYAFKPYAIQKAVELGYDSILWCDSPIHAVKSLDGIFSHIEKFGYVFFDNIGHPLGRWTNQKMLDWMHVKRESLMETKMIMACCMGFDFTNSETKMLFERYLGLANDLYPGSWDDHRHDQTVMSYLINLHKLNILNGQMTFFMYENHRFAVPINEETVCLISE